MQSLCEGVKIYLSPITPPPVPPTLANLALSQLPTNTSTVNLEVANYRDIVFLLADLWGLDGDVVKRQWLIGFFAAGLAENGSEVSIWVLNIFFIILKAHVWIDLHLPTEYWHGITQFEWI